MTVVKTKKTKAERVVEEVSNHVHAGDQTMLESVDFSDKLRPKTCLEVDFPIIPINRIATLEATTGAAKKPVYQMSKWWARRQSSVFRAMLIAAAAKCPDDPSEAAKLVWDSYYGNHGHNPSFQQLKVADIFMGGGTTIVESSRLGMEVYGSDLNPVAWLVVKNEVDQPAESEISDLLDRVTLEMRRRLMPLHACECPRGHKPKWINRMTGETASEISSLDFDVWKNFDYQGPEIVYTFWAKHGPCSNFECKHRTPIFTKPLVVRKTISVKAWKDFECKHCDFVFDVEKDDVRLSPSCTHVVADGEKPFSAMDPSGNFACPNCNHCFDDEAAALNGKSSYLGKSSNKKVACSVFVNPNWLSGDAETAGGSIDDRVEETVAWYRTRAAKMSLVEIRGEVPESVELPNGESFFTSKGTVPKRGHFECASCGTVQNTSDVLEDFGKTAPVAAYAHQGYCPECDASGFCYGGKFISAVDDPSLICLAAELWEDLSQTILKDAFPKDDVSPGLETSARTPLHKYNYTKWWHFFNERQLLCHSLFVHLFNSLYKEGEYSKSALDCVVGSFQQLLRSNCMFSFWHLRLDTLAPFLSNNNLHPRVNVVELSPFAPIGYGNWNSTTKMLKKAVEWSHNPDELVLKENLPEEVAAKIGTTKSIRVKTSDPPSSSCNLYCGTSTNLPYEDRSFDLVVTDPPFGDIMQYGELSEFFYCWLKLILGDEYPDEFGYDKPPTALEAVENYHRHKADSESFYQRILTACWAEAGRILKDGGILTFTFHHDKDGPWVAVLESLFDAGFYLECAIPIRSDDTKGEGSKPGTFGAQKVEFDIIHVCRKRMVEPKPISWARLRRQITRDVQQLQQILEQHEKAGLGEADLQVIRRGKALEYYSRHYGKVYIERGREDKFTVKDALVGINQLLDDEAESSHGIPPFNAEPYTRQFLRLFCGKSSLPRDQIQKFLRGTGVSPVEFEDRGWCKEEKKIFYLTHPLDWAKDWKGKPRKSMARDFDQAYFLIGACYEDSGIKVSDTLNSGSFAPHPAIVDLLSWFVLHGSDQEVKDAADRARSIYKSWETKHSKEVETQKSLFDLDDED